MKSVKFPYSTIANKTTNDLFIDDIVESLIKAKTHKENKDILRKILYQSGKSFGGRIPHTLYTESHIHNQVRLEKKAAKKMKELKIPESVLLPLVDGTSTTETRIWKKRFINCKHHNRTFAIDHNPSMNYLANQLFESWDKYGSRKKIEKILRTQSVDIILQSDDQILDEKELQSKGSKEAREKGIKGKFILVRHGFKDPK
jgi:hypothetical protein